MENFKIAFWNISPSKDDSLIAPEPIGAKLIHAMVTRFKDEHATRYVVDLLDTTLKQQYGDIIVTRSTDDHWRLVNGNEKVVDIFLQMIQSITEAESALEVESA